MRFHRDQSVGNSHDRQSVLATRWTLIRALSEGDADQAWRWFAGRYRQFVRGVIATVVSRNAVESLEADFWGYAFLSDAIRRADAERRFRPFLAGIVRNYARGQARDRGLSTAADESIDRLAGRETTAADLLAWTHNVVAISLRTLVDEHELAGIAIARFYGLCLDGEATEPQRASVIAEQLGASRQAVYMLLHRGRKRLRELVEAEIRAGCADEEAFREELQQLLQVAAKALPGSLDDASSAP